MLSEASLQLCYYCGSSSLDLKGLIDGACQFIVAHSQLSLGLLLEGEVLGEEIDELLWGFAWEGGGDDFEGNRWGFEGVEGLEL